MSEYSTNYCRSEKRGQPLKKKTSRRYCECGYKVRSDGHYEGSHHIAWERSKDK